MFHEGERLAPLNEMLHGGVVFKDIYVQHGLFQNAYLAWFGSKIFEPTLMGVRFYGECVGTTRFISRSIYSVCRFFVDVFSLHSYVS